MTTPTALRPNDRKSVDLVRLIDEGIDLEDALARLDWTFSGAECALRDRGLGPDIVRECARRRVAAATARVKAAKQSDVEQGGPAGRLIRMRIRQLSHATDHESRIRVAELRLLQTALTRQAAS